MSDKSSVWNKASLFLALLAVGALAAPAVGMADINPPQQIVFDFLTKSIGRSLNVRVLDPIEEPPGSDNWIVRIKVPGDPKRIALATIMTEQMKTCVPAPDSPCRFYGDTGNVLIQIVDGLEVPQPPVDPVQGADLTAQIQNLREMVNMLFQKNPLWIRAFPQNPPPAQNPTGRSVGLFLNFAKTPVQIVTNSPEDYNGRASFLPQDLFNLFLKTQVATATGVIDIFTGTVRQ